MQSEERKTDRNEEKERKRRGRKRKRNRWTRSNKGELERHGLSGSNGKNE